MEVLKIIITYVVPIIAALLSIWALFDSKKTNTLQNRVNTLEEKIKEYELEKIKREREEATKADVIAEITGYSKHYKIRFTNTGHAIAYNVDFEVPQECRSAVFRDKTPYETLEYMQSFEEHYALSGGNLLKFKVITKWNDIDGNLFSREQTVSV